MDPEKLLLTIYNDALVKLAESFERAKKAASSTAGDHLHAVREQAKTVGEIANALLAVKEVEKIRPQRNQGQPAAASTPPVNPYVPPFNPLS